MARFVPGEYVIFVPSNGQTRKAHVARISKIKEEFNQRSFCNSILYDILTEDGQNIYDVKESELCMYYSQAKGEKIFDEKKESTIKMYYSGYATRGISCARYDKVPDKEENKPKIIFRNADEIERCAHDAVPVKYIPERIIYNCAATIVFWKDGDKTVVKCSPGEKYNRYHAFCAALAKKVYGNNSRTNKYVSMGQDQTRDYKTAGDMKKEEPQKETEEAKPKPFKSFNEFSNSFAKSLEEMDKIIKDIAFGKIKGGKGNESATDSDSQH